MRRIISNCFKTKKRKKNSFNDKCFEENTTDKLTYVCQQLNLKNDGRRSTMIKGLRKWSETHNFSDYLSSETSESSTCSPSNFSSPEIRSIRKKEKSNFKTCNDCFFYVIIIIMLLILLIST